MQGICVDFSWYRWYETVFFLTLLGVTMSRCARALSGVSRLLLCCRTPRTFCASTLNKKEHQRVLRIN